MEVEREEAYEDGVEAGKAAGMATGMVAGQTLGDLNRSRQDILDLLEDLGEIPEDIQSRIYTEEDTQILRRWHKAAAKAISFDAFRAQLK